MLLIDDCTRLGVKIGMRLYISADFRNGMSDRADQGAKMGELLLDRGETIAVSISGRRFCYVALSCRINGMSLGIDNIRFDEMIDRAFGVMMDLTFGAMNNSAFGDWLMHGRRGVAGVKRIDRRLQFGDRGLKGSDTLGMGIHMRRDNRLDRLLPVLVLIMRLVRVDRLGLNLGFLNKIALEIALMLVLRLVILLVLIVPIVGHRSLLEPFWLALTFGHAVVADGCGR